MGISGEKRVNAMQLEIQERYSKASAFILLLFFSFSCYFHTLTMSLTFALILAFLQSEDYMAKQRGNELLRHCS